MTNQDILTLANAGFTAQQIAALNQVTPVAMPVEQQIQQPAPHMQQQIQQPLDAMSQQIAALTQAVQAGAIAGTSQPKVQTTDEILAEIINPPSVLAAQNGGSK